jgi:potassium-dependent mechanosensitive channel
MQRPEERSCGVVCVKTNPFIGRRRALAAALLWLGLMLPVPALAQQPIQPPGATSPIPPPEIASQAAEVQALLENVDALSAPSPESLAIEQALPERSRRIQAGWATSIERLAGKPSAPQLEDMDMVWGGRRADLKTWANHLAAEASRLQQEQQRLTELHEVWTRSFREMEGGKAPPQLRQEIDGILAAIKAAQARVNARLANLLVLQYQVALEIRRCDDVLARIAQAKENLVSHLGEVDAPPIWTPELWRAAVAQMGPGIQEAASRWTRQLFFVARNRTARIALQAVLFVVLLIPLVRARRHAQVWILPDTGVAPAARMLERPASAALVLTLLATPWFYPSYAFAVSRLATLLGIPPALRLLTPVASRAQARGLYGFSVVIAVEALRPLLSTAPELDHVLVLAEMLCSSLLLGWILLAERRAGPAQTADRPAGRSRGASVVITILWLAFVAAFVAGAAGYLQLARLVGDAALESTYTALAILIGIWLLLVLFAYALWARPLGALESVRRNRAVLERRAGRILRALGSLAWVLISLRPLTVFDAPAGVLRALLSAGVAWGAVRITVGDVLLFGVTVWAAFTLAAIVRAVLEIDVFPRVRLAQGVPVALASLSRYAILLAGFILGLAALGVDLTKVTILVGAFGVGVGLGLQTLAGNFAAWLVLLFERPIREGDVVQVGDVQGEVRHIGVRASTMRTGRGADVFVPNSHLLTEKLTNWTYLDRTLRLDLPVSVAFGSDPRRVIEVLCRVAAAHPDVQREPAPAAFCLGLGPNGLSFELRMWTSHFERADSIRSQVAEAVCAALIEEKIAFR